MIIGSRMVQELYDAGDAAPAKAREVMSEFRTAVDSSSSLGDGPAANASLPLGGGPGSMSWFRKLLPPKIKREEGGQKKAVPEGLWSKCPSCEAVLYFTDLENNLHVCPKCSFHNRLSARQRLDLFLDPEARAELASEVVPLDPLKFKDSR